MDAVSAVTPQDLKRIQAAAKLHPAIAALIERLRKQDSKPGAEEARFVRDGKAEIQIWLAEKNAAVLAELKRLGFEVMLEPRSANLLIGRLPVTSLAALAELATVRYIAPSQSR